MPWLPGTRIDSYEIVGLLGDGGMGEVFRVRHLISDRIEAMKVLLSAASSNQEMLDRFTREIRVLAAEIESDDARQKFLASVRGQLRSSGLFITVSSAKYNPAFADCGPHLPQHRSAVERRVAGLRP